MQQVKLTEDGAWLYDVKFPFGFFTGIRLTCATSKGGAVVWVSTDALENETEIGGRKYGFALDPNVIDPKRARQRIPVFLDRCTKTIDRFGEEMGARWHRLDATSIAQLIFGPEADDVAMAAVLAALQGAPEVVHADSTEMWWHQVPISGRRIFGAKGSTGGIFAGPSADLRRSVETAAERHVREHRVVLHLRRLACTNTHDGGPNACPRPTIVPLVSRPRTAAVCPPPCLRVTPSWYSMLRGRRRHRPSVEQWAKANRGRR